MRIACDKVFVAHLLNEDRDLEPLEKYNSCFARTHPVGWPVAGWLG